MSTTDTTTRQPPILISYDDERQIVFSPKDENRFVKKCSEVVRICAAADEGYNFSHEFRGMLSAMAKWLLANKERWVGCFVGLCDGQTVITVISKMEVFDHQLSDDLTDLEIQFADDFPLVDCQVTHLPNRAQLIQSCMQDEALSFGG